MNWEKFEDSFHHSWHEVMRPFIESEVCDRIYEQLKFEGRRGKRITPLSHNTFRCFKLTPLWKLKLVLAGMCPYHTMKKGNVYVADGLLMGCSNTQELQPSLQKFYDGVERDCYNGLELNKRKHWDVSFLAQQGVLMFNVALTTEVNKAGAHFDIWKPFTEYFFTEVVAKRRVITVFLGQEAARYKHLLPIMSWNFELPHPASAAYKNTDWETNKTFKKINKMLVDENKEPIQWLYDPSVDYSDIDLPF